MHHRLPSRLRDRASRGQSLVEFALVLPLLLLLVLIALDFGRVYLGYINMQNMARIAANYAANNPTAAWGTPADPTVTAYRNRIINDARATNCALPVVSGQPVIPSPVFTDAGGNGTTTDVGDQVSVSLTCSFQIITPVISALVGTGGTVPVSTAAVFPIKKGMIGTGGGITIQPVAAFTASPLTGPAPLVVRFTDQSTNGPTAWAWDIALDGALDGIADYTTQDPQVTLSTPGTYSVTLVASNSAGAGTITKTSYITVGPSLAVVSFTGTPTSGARPLTVQFQDTSSGSPTAWAWDFDNNGVVDSTLQNPSHTYTTVGTYTVRLTVTNAGGPSSGTITNMITVSVGTCTVPNFANVWSENAQTIWSGAGFTTQVNFQQGNLPWTIKSQNQVVGQVIPCNSPITVSKN